MIQIGEKKRDYFLVIKNYRKQKQKSQKSPAIKAARVAPHLNVKTRNMMAQEKFMEAQSREASYVFNVYEYSQCLIYNLPFSPQFLTEECIDFRLSNSEPAIDEMAYKYCKCYYNIDISDFLTLTNTRYTHDNILGEY